MGNRLVQKPHHSQRSFSGDAAKPGILLQKEGCLNKTEKLVVIYKGEVTLQ